MAGGTVLVWIAGRVCRSFVVVTVKTERADRYCQQSWLITGMGGMTADAFPFGKGVMAKALLPFCYQFLMAGITSLSTLADQELCHGRTVGTVACRALTRGERTMNAESAHILGNRIMAFGTKLQLVFNQDASDFTLMAAVTGQAFPFLHGGVIDRILRGHFRMTTLAQIFRWTFQKIDLPGGGLVRDVTALTTPLGDDGMRAALAGFPCSGAKKIEFMALETK